MDLYLTPAILGQAWSVSLSELQFHYQKLSNLGFPRRSMKFWPYRLPIHMVLLSLFGDYPASLATKRKQICFCVVGA